jgi:hypothetical protein
MRVLFLMVLKIRLNMALAMVTAYGPYSNGYTDEEKPRHFYDAIKKNYKQKGKKIIVGF